MIDDLGIFEAHNQDPKAEKHSDDEEDGSDTDTADEGEDNNKQHEEDLNGESRTTKLMLPDVEEERLSYRLSLLNFPSSKLGTQGEVPEDFIPDSELDTLHPPEFVTTTQDKSALKDHCVTNSSKTNLDATYEVSLSEINYMKLSIESEVMNKGGEITHIKDTEERTKKGDSATSSDEETLENLQESNKNYQPFRTQSSMQHVNSHLLHRDVRADNVSATSSTMDPTLIRCKVKSQAKQREAKLKARRTRKSGEASLATKARRDNQMEVKQSLSSIWY